MEQNQTYINQSDTLVYAGFFIRLAAFAMDMVLVNLALLPIRGCVYVINILWDESILRNNILFHLNICDIIYYLITVLYFVLMTYVTGRTLGKMALELQVVSNTGKPLSFIDVLYRETIGRFLSSLMGIGYILIFSGKEKQALHDILCGTKVIYRFRRVRQMPVVKGDYETGEPMNLYSEEDGGVESGTEYLYPGE